MDRYNVIDNKNNREIVLLKSFPCVWGKCAFCDYIEDNSKNTEEIIKLNKEVLSNVKGIYGVLEVINSGSVFELPKETLEEIKRIVVEKNIKKLFFEAHWCYSIETFDDHFRNDILNKNARFNDVEEVKKYFKSICLMVGIKGQTKDMIKRDMDILLNNFKYGTVNIWTENTTSFKRDEELIKWFEKEYSFLKDNKTIEVLFENTDFGVGD